MLQRPDAGQSAGSRDDRVGAFTHIDEIYPTRLVKRAAAPWTVQASAGRIVRSGSGRRERTYLSRNPVTGLLIARDDRILFEHYQYGRTDRDRLVSQSMVKSITGLLIGIAIAEGAIKSVDDTAETYVPGFKGTRIRRDADPRSPAHVVGRGFRRGDGSSGRDLDRLWSRHGARLVSGKGTVASITQFNRRIAPAGTQFRYASIEPDVLGLVLRYATGKSLSDYLQEKDLAADRRGSRCEMAAGCRRIRVGPLRLQRRVARLCAARPPARP